MNADSLPYDDLVDRSKSPPYEETYESTSQITLDHSYENNYNLGVLIMDQQVDKTEIFRRTKPKIDFNSETFNINSGEEHTQMDYHTIPNSPYVGKLDVYLELKDKKRKIDTEINSFFCHGENYSEERNKMKCLKALSNILSESLNEKLDKLAENLNKSPSIHTSNDTNGVNDSDSSKAFYGNEESYSRFKQESKSSTSEPHGIEPSQDVRATVLHSIDSKVSFINVKNMTSYDNGNRVLVTNGDSINVQSAITNDFIKGSSALNNDSWERQSSLIDDSSHSIENKKYSNFETVDRSRCPQAVTHVGKLTDVFLDVNMDYVNRKPETVLATVDDSVQAQSSENHLEGEVTEFSPDDEDSIDDTSDTDESFSWYYDEPEDFIDDPVIILVPQVVGTQIVKEVGELMKISLADGKTIDSDTCTSETVFDTNKVDTVSVYGTKNDSTELYPTDKDSTDGSSTTNESEDFIDKRINTVLVLRSKNDSTEDSSGRDEKSDDSSISDESEDFIDEPLANISQGKALGAASNTRGSAAASTIAINPNSVILNVVSDNQN
ncbi:uncharacterized protein NPIL_643051 [Nephila pilipes]|uniref:Uncharacterized protein n=1 Tax=Nephila pilipes TaxID=299642 RepID=A0A8X6QTX5_NEPPI|nr:uncharacterized protein NPIL_643051 [Nephila pilipes]